MRVTHVNILVIKYSTRKSTVLAYAYNKIPKVWAPHVQTKKISESLPPTHPPPPFRLSAMSTRSRRTATTGQSNHAAARRSPNPGRRSNKRKSGALTTSSASGGSKRRRNAAAKSKAHKKGENQGGVKKQKKKGNKDDSSSSSEEDLSSSSEEVDGDDDDDDDDDEQNGEDFEDVDEDVDEQGEEDPDNDNNNKSNNNKEILSVPLVSSSSSSSSSSSQLSSNVVAAQGAAVIFLRFNPALLTIPNSCAWKPVLSNEDYMTLQMLLTESVVRSLPHCHIQDPRSVENIARHLTWTQIWDIDQARVNDHDDLTPLDKTQTSKIISGAVQHCVNLALRNDSCVLFDRIWENQQIFDELHHHLRTRFPSMESGGQQIVIDAFIAEAVKFVKSAQFLNLVCKEMFNKEGMPRFQCTEAVLRRLFKEWIDEGTTTKAMKEFIVRIVDRTSHVFINQRVRQYLN